MKMVMSISSPCPLGAMSPTDTGPEMVASWPATVRPTALATRSSPSSASTPSVPELGSASSASSAGSALMDSHGRRPIPPSGVTPAVAVFPATPKVRWRMKSTQPTRAARDTRRTVLTSVMVVTNLVTIPVPSSPTAALSPTNLVLPDAPARIRSVSLGQGTVALARLGMALAPQAVPPLAASPASVPGQVAIAMPRTERTR